MNAFQVILALLFAASCAYTVLGYPSRYGALSGRSRLFRTVGLFLLNLLLGLVLLYTFIDFKVGASDRAAALRAIIYLLACIFLGLSLMCIAVLDWLESLVAYRNAQRDILYKMAREENDADETGKGNGGGAKPNGAA